jgi:hypothetical protein
MATHRAIAAVSLTLRDILRERYAASGLGTSLNAELYQNKNFGSPMKEGIALFLWRIVPNGNRRNPGIRTDVLGRRFRPSLPVDLSYLVVPFADDSDRQQRLFGWMLRTIDDIGPLLASRLNNALSESDVFHPGEALELVLEPLSVSDHLTVWDRIKTMPLFANYVVRMLMLDSEAEITEAPLVVERGFEVGVLK